MITLEQILNTPYTEEPFIDNVPDNFLYPLLLSDYEELGSLDLKVRVHLDHNFDYRRYLKVVSVWNIANTIPVFVYIRYGREGRDEVLEYRLSPEGWLELYNYVSSKIKDYPAAYYNLADSTQPVYADYFDLVLKEGKLCYA